MDNRMSDLEEKLAILKEKLAILDAQREATQKKLLEQYRNSHLFIEVEDVKFKIRQVEVCLEMEKKKEKQKEGIAKLKSLGFEIRSGHGTSAINYYSQTPDCGEAFLYVITHKARPEILRISIESHHRQFQIDSKEGVDFPKKWILGYGATPEEAWIHAWDIAQDPRYLEKALCD